MTKNMIDSSPVMNAMTKTAVHTLNHYGDHDPEGEAYVYGLTKLAEMVNTLCGADGQAVVEHHLAIAAVRKTQVPTEVPPVTVDEMRETQTLLRGVIEGLEPDAPDTEKLTASFDFFNDFWETYHEGN